MEEKIKLAIKEMMKFLNNRKIVLYGDSQEVRKALEMYGLNVDIVATGRKDKIDDSTHNIYSLKGKSSQYYIVVPFLERIPEHLYRLLDLGYCEVSDFVFVQWLPTDKSKKIILYCGDLSNQLLFKYNIINKEEGFPTDYIATIKKEGSNLNVMRFRKYREEDVEGILVLHSNLYEAFQNIKDVFPNIPCQKIIDGRILYTKKLAWREFFDTGVVKGRISPTKTHASMFSECTHAWHQRVYQGDKLYIELGEKSYIGSSRIEWGIAEKSILKIGKFCSLAWDVVFEIGLNNHHVISRVSNFDTALWGWDAWGDLPKVPVRGEIIIGNDVWVAKGCRLKSADKPLIIGDGAVIAANSVVVKDVPPYAIVGGNPARVIKYRFPPDIISAMMRIKWFDWDIEKIHDNLKYFTDPKEFVRKFDVV